MPTAAEFLDEPESAASFLDAGEAPSAAAFLDEGAPSPQVPLPDRVPRGGGAPIPRSTPTAEDATLVQRAMAEGKPVIMVDGKPTIGETPSAPPLSAGDQFTQGVERGLGGAALGVAGGVARLTGNTETADALGKDLQAMGSVLPEQTTGGKVGTGVGGALALMSGGGLPGALGIAGTQAVAGGYDAAYAKALQEGKPEEEARTEAQKGAFKSAAIAVPELAAYWLLGAGAAKIVSPLVKNAGPVVKTAAATAAATAANVTTSTGLHAIHGDPLFTPEGLAMDVTFGFAHAVAAGREAGASETRVREMLKDAPLESLEIAAADPAFRKASPYRPELIDAEIARRKQPVSEVEASRLKELEDRILSREVLPPDEYAELGKLQERREATVPEGQAVSPERTPPATPEGEAPLLSGERAQGPLVESTAASPEQVKQGGGDPSNPSTWFDDYYQSGMGSNYEAAIGDIQKFLGFKRKGQASYVLRDPDIRQAVDDVYQSHGRDRGDSEGHRMAYQEALEQAEQFVQKTRQKHGIEPRYVEETTTPSAQTAGQTKPGPVVR